MTYLHVPQSSQGSGQIAVLWLEGGRRSGSTLILNFNGLNDKAGGRSTKSDVQTTKVLFSIAESDNSARSFETEKLRRQTLHDHVFSASQQSRSAPVCFLLYFHFAPLRCTLSTHMVFHSSHIHLEDLLDSSLVIQLAKGQQDERRILLTSSGSG